MPENPQNSRSESCLFAFLNFTVAVRQITLIPSTTSFSCSASFQPLSKHAEKSDHNSDARGRPGQRKLHDDRLADELGPLVAHLKAPVTLQRGEGLDICPRRRPEVVVGDTRQVARYVSEINCDFHSSR